MYIGWYLEYNQLSTEERIQSLMTEIKKTYIKLCAYKSADDWAKDFYKKLTEQGHTSIEQGHTLTEKLEESLTDIQATIKAMDEASRSSDPNQKRDSRHTPPQETDLNLKLTGAYATQE